jgi:hypothetical protein
MTGLKVKGGLPEGAGVVAEQRFEKGQMLCTVPAHVMMTTATAIRSKVRVLMHMNSCALHIVVELSVLFSLLVGR